VFRNTDNWADVEDRLKKLDRLTQEEAEMAAAHVLKATHTVDDAGRVRGVADIALSVGDQVHDVGDQVQGVGDQVQAVGDQVQDVGDQVQDVGDQVQGVGDQVHGVSDQVHGVSDQVQAVGDQVQAVGDQVHGVGDQVQGVSVQLRVIDDVVAAVRDGAQYTFNQSSKNCLIPNVHRWKRGQDSYATSGRWRTSDRTFVVSELHSCYSCRLNYRHRESVTTRSS
jgi:methyl-accepting chemotaxis protein